MKTKDLLAPILLIALGIAFLAVSLWVFFSKNRKSIHYKYKLGGMILSLSFFAATHQSCKSTEVMCYAPIPNDFVNFSVNNRDSLSNNDTVFVAYEYGTYSYLSYMIADSARNTIVDNQLVVTTSSELYLSRHYITLEAIPDSYRGQIFVSIFGESAADSFEQRNILHTEEYYIRH